MSEFREDSNIFDANGNGIQIQGHLKADAPDEERENALVDELAALIEDTTPDNFDEDRLDAILGELNVIAPLDYQVDGKKSLARFYEKNSDILKLSNAVEVPQQNEKTNSAKILRFPVRKLAVVAATIVIMLASMVTAQAFGVDVFGYLARWTSDVFYFAEDPEYNPVEEATVQVYPMEEGESQKFDSLDTAVAAFGISAPIVPHWFPESLGETVVTGTVTPSGMLIYAFPTDDNDEFYIDYSESSEALVQKDLNAVQTYIHGGIVHYLMTDGTLRKVTWVNGDITCYIAGNFSEQEMKHIINSIYEG